MENKIIKNDIKNGKKRKKVPNPDSWQVEILLNYVNNRNNWETEMKPEYYLTADEYWEECNNKCDEDSEIEVYNQAA